MRKTKIIATLGHSSNNIEMLQKMIASGVYLACINFSHGTIEKNNLFVLDANLNTKLVNTSAVSIDDKKTIARR